LIGANPPKATPGQVEVKILCLFLPVFELFLSAFSQPASSTTTNLKFLLNANTTPVAPQSNNATFKCDLMDQEYLGRAFRKSRCRWCTRSLPMRAGFYNTGISVELARRKDQ